MVQKINALKVSQWLPSWDDVIFEGTYRSKPDAFFYLFSINAKTLRKLSNIHRRKREGSNNNIGVQRKHDKERSAEIANYIINGYPWSSLNEKQRKNQDNDKVKMPGWLPTAIIANIFVPNVDYNGLLLEDKYAIKIEDANDGYAKIIIPEDIDEDNWQPELHPISIIDGQHRLLAFDQLGELEKDYDLPVVAFYNLDIAWQAYLFYTINIRPKRIKPSLAYDLFPLLRTQDWLEKAPEGLVVYKETRAQELTEILWGYNKNPWYHRINLLDNPGEGSVSQAAFIRTLLSSFVKNSNVREGKIGGLYGDILYSSTFLSWDRFVQGAFLSLIWTTLNDKLLTSQSVWLKNLNDISSSLQLRIEDSDLKINVSVGLTSKFSLLNADQGVRGFLQVVNDLVFLNAQELDLNNLSILNESLSERREILESDSIDYKYIDKAVDSLKQNTKLFTFIIDICEKLVEFDWRTSSTPDLGPQEKLIKLGFRGSGGYSEIRKYILNHLTYSNNERVSELSKNILTILS